MTTKKQRREAVEEKRQARIAEDKRIGLAAQERASQQRAQVEIEADRATRSKKTAMALSRIDSNKKVGDLTVGEFLSAGDKFYAQSISTLGDVSHQDAFMSRALDVNR